MYWVTKKFIRIALLQYSLCCGGLELNLSLQYLRAMPAPRSSFRPVYEVWLVGVKLVILCLSGFGWCLKLSPSWHNPEFLGPPMARDFPPPFHGMGNCVTIPASCGSFYSHWASGGHWQLPSTDPPFLLQSISQNLRLPVAGFASPMSTSLPFFWQTLGALLFAKMQSYTLLPSTCPANSQGLEFLKVTQTKVHFVTQTVWWKGRGSYTTFSRWLVPWKFNSLRRYPPTCPT